MISGLFVSFLMLMFLGLFGWAYSSRRHEDFARAAQSPLVDEERHS
jgi:cbb3-type cytochrome oxidase subunit 3